MALRRYNDTDPADKLSGPVAGYPDSGYDSSGNFHYYPGGPAFRGPAQIPTGSHFVPGPGGVGGTTYYDYGGGNGSGGNWNGSTTPLPGFGSTTAQTGDPAQQAAQAQANQSAMGILENELASWGLSGLESWAWGEITSGKSVDQIIFDLRQTDTYKSSIFGQTNSQRTANGLPVLDENTILQFKDQAMQIARSAGLPQGFMTDTELASLMGMDVSISEVNERISTAYLHATQAPQDLRDQLAARGVDTGHLAAYYMDPTKALPFLKQQLASADISVQAQRTGFAGVAISDADRLAQEGVTEAQAKTGFGDLGTLKPLFTALPGSGEQNIGTNVALGAEFEANAQDKLMIQRRQDQRIAAFRGGGRFGENTGGVEGLGLARSA